MVADTINLDLLFPFDRITAIAYFLQKKKSNITNRSFI